MIAESSFEPAVWLSGPHSQTLWASVIRQCSRPRLRRERLELPDGDFLDLDWSDHGRGPTIMILHGLEGSSDSNYARGLLNRISTLGWRGVVMHFRSCSGESNRQSRSYCAGETADVGHVVGHILGATANAPLIPVGYSLGGSALLNWLAEAGARAR